MVQWKDLLEIEKELQLFHPDSEIWGLGGAREVSKLPLNSHEFKAWISAQAGAAPGTHRWNPLNILLWIPLCAAEFLENT